MLFANLYGTSSLSFFWYSPQKCAKIGAYAYVHGAAATARHFSNKMGTSVNESTVRSIKSCYKDELRKQQTGSGSSVVKLLPEKNVDKRFCWVMN